MKFFSESTFKAKARDINILCIALTALGLLGNYLKYPIFLNIDFLFGSICSMLILQLGGFRRGLVASLFISSYTYLLWNHPYAIVIMTCEIAIVGWLTQRHKVGFVLADTLYWLLVGIPLAYLFYGLVMQVSTSVYITMVKQAMNGITNTLIARLLFSVLVFKTRSLLLPMRELSANLLASFIIFPTLLILMVNSRADFREMEEGVRKLLRRSSQSATDILQNWLNDRRFAIVHLAEAAAKGNLQQTQLHLEQLRLTDINIERCGFFDKDATISAYSPLEDELGLNNIGKNFADRSHVQAIKQSLQPMLTEIFLGRIGVPKPIIIMAAPVLVQGEYTGYVTGNIKYEQLRNFLDGSIHDDLIYVLVDRENRVIVTNHQEQQIMEPFRRGEGQKEQLKEGLTSFIPKMPKNTAISERWKRSLYIAEANIGQSAEWKLILEQSIGPFQKALYDRYTKRLFSLFAMLLAGLALAEILSRRMVMTTERLSCATSDLPERLQHAAPPIQWPTSGVVEVNQLINNFKKMADSLRAQFLTIQENTLFLEKRVDERTRALRDSRNLFRVLADYAPVGIFQTDGHGDCTFVNKKWCELTGITEAQAMGTGWISALHPADRESVGRNWYAAAQSNQEYATEYRFQRPDGIVAWVQGNAVAVYKENSDEKQYIGCVVDITDRKKATEEILLAKEQAIVANHDKSKLLTTVAHEFRTPLALLASSLDILDRYGRKLSDEQRSTQGKFIRSASAQLKELVNTVLSYNQMQTDQPPESAQMVDIVEVCRVLADEIKATWSAGHDFQFFLNLADGRMVLNEVLFRRMLGNLLLNAFQYTSPGGSIALHVDRIDDWLQVAVRDQGIGISASDQEHVFDSFFRGNNVENRRGMGLGLSIVSDAVGQLGGTITMTSELGRGTTVRVQLPWRDQHSS